MALVLLVEDHAAFARSFARQLIKQSLEVLITSDRGAALAHLEGRPQIRGVIADVRLGEHPRGGLEVARAFLERRADVPRFVMTASLDPSVRREAMECGAYFFDKPGTPATHRQIARLIRDAEARRTPSILPPGEPAPVADPQRREALALAVALALSDAETRVLVEAMGAPPSEVVAHVAARLAIAEATVLKHFNAVRAKSGDKTIADLLARVRRQALARALLGGATPPQ